MRRSIPSAAILLLVILTGLTAPAPLSGQTIGESLGGMTAENARRYLRPVFEGLGYSLNNGFGEDASVHPRFGFDFGVRVMGAFVPDVRKSFVPLREVTFGETTFTGDAAFVPQSGSDLATPTAVGPGEGTTLAPGSDYRQALVDAGQDPDDPVWSLPMPDGFDIPAIPFVILQAGLGVGFNTEVTVRLLPEVEINPEVGDAEALGFGARHEITGWIPASPVDVTLEGGYQDFQVEEYLDATTTTLGLTVGRSVGPLDLYVVGRNTSPEIDVSYTVENPDGNPALAESGVPIRFSPPVEADTRYGLGFNLHFLLMNLSGQYSFGEYDVASVKVGLSFR